MMEKSPGRACKGSFANPIVLPAISADTERQMMMRTRTYKTRNDEDRSFESLAMKLYERFEDEEEIINVNDVAKEEGEDPKRIYDIFNIFEGLGLVAKLGVKTYNKLGKENARAAFARMKLSAAAMETQVASAMVQHKVVQFNQNPAEIDQGNQYHLTRLTEKIMVILLSVEGDSGVMAGGLSYKQILSLLYQRGENKTAGVMDSVRQKVSRVLKSLVGLGVLSSVKISEREIFYKLQDSTFLTVPVQYPDMLITQQVEDGEDEVREEETSTSIYVEVGDAVPVVEFSLEVRKLPFTFKLLSNFYLRKYSES